MQLLPFPTVLLLLLLPELRIVGGGAGAPQYVRQQGTRTWRRRWRRGRAATGASAARDGTQLIGQRFALRRIPWIGTHYGSQQLLLLLLSLHIRLHRILLQRLQCRIGQAMRLARLQIGEFRRLCRLRVLAALEVIDALRHRMPSGLHCSASGRYHRKSGRDQLD